MKDIEKIVKTAITSLLTLTTATTLAHTPDSMDKMEKCYGIVKTAMNDCETANSSCAGSSTKDKQPDAYILLPKGICKRIVDGSLTPKTDNKK